MSDLSRTRRIALLVMPLLVTTAALWSLPGRSEAGVVPVAATGLLSGSGKPAQETRNAIGEFDAVRSSGSFDLRIRHGAREAVEVSADDNLLPLLQTEVETGLKGRTLVVRWKRGESIQTRSPVMVTVTVVKLRSVSSEGSGDIAIEKLATPQLALALSGSGNFDVRELATEDLQIQIAGSGDVKAGGKTTKLRIAIAGSGNVSSTELAADDVTVSIAGSGDAKVQAQKTLNARVAGSGDVIVTGAAAIRSTVAGSGTVRQQH